MANEKKLYEMESDPNIWINLGVTYASKKDWEKALTAYERALSIDDKNPTFFNNSSLRGAY